MATTRSKEIRSGAIPCPVTAPYPKQPAKNEVVKLERTKPPGELDGPKNPYGGTRTLMRG